MGAWYDSGMYDNADIRGTFPNDYRPIPIGSKLLYYDGEKKLNIVGEVKASTVTFIWIVDVDTREQHFIMYCDIVKVLEIKGI